MLQDVSMKSLKTKVTQSPALLEQLAWVWGWSSSETYTLPSLLGRIQSPFFARSVWQRLDADERLCLFHLLTHSSRGKGVPVESLRRKTKLPRPAFMHAVSRLSEHWLLLEEGEIPGKQPGRGMVAHPVPPERGIFAFRECCDALAQTGQEIFFPSSSRAQMPLARLLLAFSGDELRDLARSCHIPFPSSSSPAYYSARSSSLRTDPFEVQKKIEEALQQPLIVFDLVRGCEPAGQHLFLWLGGQPDGQASHTEIEAHLHMDEETLSRLLRLLESRSLAFDTFLPEASRIVCIPREILTAIKPHLEPFLEDERTYAFVPQTTPPSFVHEAQPWICYDLAVIVGLTYHMAIEPTKDHRLMKRQSGKVRPLLHGRPRLGETDQDLYPDMVLAAARQLKILQRTRPYDDAKFRYTRGTQFGSWCQSDLAGHVRQFLAWWERTPEWMEVAVGDQRSPSPTWEIHRKRKQLLGQLRACTPGAWYSVDALLYALWKQSPLELGERGYQKSLAAGSNALRTHWKTWRKTHEEQYRGMLTSTLHEAGIVSLGYAHAPDEHPAAFLVTELGAAALTEQTHEENRQEHADDTRHLLIQPNFEILVLRMEIPLLYQVIAFADIDCLEQVSRFHLRKSSVLDGLAAGLSIEDILDFLRRTSRVGVPQNVEYTLLDWSKNYQEARVSEAMLIEVSGQDVVRAVQRALEARSIPMRQLGPNLVAIPLQSMPRSDIYRFLEKAGVVVREVTV